MSLRLNRRRKGSKPSRRDTPDPERELRHLGYAMCRPITDGSPYSLAMGSYRRTFDGRGGV